MRMIQLAAALAAFGSAAALAPAAAAADFADHASIDRAVENFTGTPIGQPGGASLPVDRRLRLAGCGRPLALEWYGNGQDTVLVRCPVAGGWRLFVPLESGMAMSAPASTRSDQLAEDAVRRGEAVTVSVSGDGFTLSRQAEALDSGAIGEWIRVRPVGKTERGRNLDAIRAQIIRPGQVGMKLP